MFHRPPAPAAALALSLGLALAACGSPADNRSLYSVNQPVVEQQVHALDLQAGAGGLAPAELRRLDSWLEALDVGFGDELALDGLAAGAPVRDQVAALLARRGLLLADGAPAGESVIAPGLARIRVSRARAFVPRCPNWSDRQGGNYGNATSADYGCAVNANLAAMVADPSHLLSGAQANGVAAAADAVKAIETHRERVPTGAAPLPQVSSVEN